MKEPLYSPDSRWSGETQTAVAVYLADWYNETAGFDSTAQVGAAGLLRMLADTGLLVIPEGILVVENKPEPPTLKPDPNDGCYVACDFEVTGRHSWKCEISPLGKRLNGERVVVSDICMVPDCGCSGEAHP